MQFDMKEFKREIEVTRLANIQYFEFTNEYHTVLHNHDFSELVYVDSGEITVNSESYTGKISKNELIIHKPNEMHTLFCNRNAAPNVIVIGFECSSEKLDIFSAKSIKINPEYQNVLVGIIKEGMKVFMPPYDVPYTTDMKKRHDFEFGADQLIQLQLELFLIELIRLSMMNSNTTTLPKSDIKNSEVHDYITANYKKKITLNELCFLFSTNKTTLCSDFKKSYGESIVSYINKLKIKEAKSLMRKENMTLTEVADKVGFSSLHYFSRCFKKIENKSPSEYIESIKSKLNM